MSFTTPHTVPSGSAQPVREVEGRPPAELSDFEGDIAFVVGEELRYEVRGSGRVTGDVVRFHEKDVDNSGKDIRVWQVRKEQSGFLAEHAAAF